MYDCYIYIFIYSNINVFLELMTSHMLDIVKEARSKALGPFSPSMNLSENLYARLNKVIHFFLLN